MRATILVLLLCLFGLLSTAHGQSDTRPGIRPGLEESPFGYEFIPPLTRAELDRYAILLTLSEAQSQFVDSEFEEYGQRVQDLDRRLVPLLLSAATAAMAAQGKQERRFEGLQNVYEIRKMEHEFSSNIERLDERLFANIASVLAEEQKPALVRVSLHRQRHRCIKWGSISKAKLDIAQIIEQSQFDEGVVRDIDAVLFEYERAVTPLMVKLEHARRAWRISAIEDDLAEIIEAQSSTPEDERRRYAESLLVERETKRGMAVAQQAIADCNEKHLPLVLNGLPERESQIFNQRFLEQTYREVYPDDADPKDLYFKVIASDAIDAELGLLLDSIWTEYRANYNRMTDLLCKMIDEWQVSLAFAEGRAHEQNLVWEEHTKEVNSRRYLRSEKSLEFVARLKGLLPPEVLEVHGKHIDRWVETQKVMRMVYAPK